MHLDEGSTFLFAHLVERSVARVMVWNDNNLSNSDKEVLLKVI